jgi:hypothetical protein
VGINTTPLQKPMVYHDHDRVVSVVCDGKVGHKIDSKGSKKSRRAARDQDIEKVSLDACSL